MAKVKIVDLVCEVSLFSFENKAYNSGESRKFYDHKILR